MGMTQRVAVLPCDVLVATHWMVPYMLQGGQNALHLAVRGNHVEVAKALVEEFGLSVTHRDSVSCTLLYVI